MFVHTTRRPFYFWWAPQLHDIHKAALVSLLTVLQDPQKRRRIYFLCFSNIFSWCILVFPLLCSVSRLIKHLHLQLFQSLNPLMGPKETEAQYLAERQTPCCTCSHSSRSVFSSGCSLPQGQWEEMEGWTEDLRGGLGQCSPSYVPTLQVEWTKCLLTGTNTQLFGALPLGQASLQRHVQHLVQHLQSPLFLKTMKRKQKSKQDGICQERYYCNHHHISTF